MATKKKLLQAAAGTAAAAGGAAGLNIEQIFSTYLHEGNGTAQAIDNGIALGDQYDGGSAEFTDKNDSFPINLGSTLNLTGDFTFEVFINLNSTFSPSNVMAGSDLSVTNDQIAISSSGIIQTYTDDNGGTIVSSTTAITLGTWHHVAISRSGSTMYFFIDGVAAGTGTTSYTFSLKAIGALGNYTGASVKGYMSNLRISNNARYTSAFTAPTSDLSADANTLLLALQGTDPFTDQSGNYTLTVSNTVKASTFGPYYADAGEGGLVWFKNRDQPDPHQLYDTERGVTKRLKSDSTDAEAVSSNGLTAFNSNGFTIGAATTINTSGEDIASWTFRKAPKFFTCLTYSGTGTAQSISHDLGTTVGTLIVKRTDSSDNWRVYHRGMDATSPQNYFIALNGYSQKTAASTIWNNTAPTDTTFTVGTSSSVNASGGTYVAYLFAHNDGDGDFGDGTQDIIKCGSYTGNGSSTGPEIDLGFEPQWVLVKNANANENWMILDSMRGLTSGVTDGDARLYPNSSAAEAAATRIKPLPNGFQPEDSDPQINSSGSTYIYIAIRRGPMAVPTDATDVFAPVLGTDTTDWKFDAGFPVDLHMYKQQASTGNTFVFDRVRGGEYLRTNTTDAGVSFTTDFDYMNYVDVSGSTINGWMTWNWKRAPSFFDVVAYTGNGTAGRTVSHNLGVAPEMMWVKSRDLDQQWAVYHKGIDATAPEDYFLRLNEADARVDNVNRWNDTSPASDVFTLGSHSTVNQSSATYIAYLFASLDGVSKVGSYTGTGSDQNIDCGFSNGARFVLIKNTTTAKAWFVFDTERGITTGNDPYLKLNDTSAEGTTFDLVDPYSNGFAVTGSNSGINASGETYIFYAVSA